MNNVRFVFLIFLFAVLTADLPVRANPDSIRIHGVLTDTAQTADARVSLSFTDHAGKTHSHQLILKEGYFELQVPRQQMPVEANLRVWRPGPPAMLPSLTLFLSGTDISITGTMDELDLAQVSGGQENDDYNMLRQSAADLSRQLQELYTPVRSGAISTTSEEGTAIMKRITALNREEAALQMAFIDTHPQSYVSLFLLRRLKVRYTSHRYAETFATLNPQYKMTRIAQDIQADIDREAVTAKGLPAIEFERTTAGGEPFKLSQLQGRVVLLDFWGSWCGPCIASMPHLLELYERYKEDGFEIVGIAQERGQTLEACRVSWLKAIDELGIYWTNVLNNENRETMDIARSYNISAYPTKILLDTEGKVILRLTASATDDIDRALEEIYGY